MALVTVFWPSTMLAEGETGDQKFDKRRSAVLSSDGTTALAISCETVKGSLWFQQSVKLHRAGHGDCYRAGRTARNIRPASRVAQIGVFLENKSSHRPGECKLISKTAKANRGS